MEYFTRIRHILLQIACRLYIFVLNFKYPWLFYLNLTKNKNNLIRNSYYSVNIYCRKNMNLKRPYKINLTSLKIVSLRL